jgi:hypothetical protein
MTAPAVLGSVAGVRPQSPVEFGFCVGDHLIGNAHGIVTDNYALGRVIAGDRASVGGLVGYFIGSPGMNLLTGEIRRESSAVVFRATGSTAPIALGELRGSATPGPAVLVHGDLHGDNQVWDHGKLRLVVDLETAGAAEPEYDLRHFPGPQSLDG